MTEKFTTKTPKKARRLATVEDLEAARLLVEVSPQDAAWLANQSYRRFRERMAKGQIPGCRRIGRRWHIASKPFLAWIENPSQGEVIS
jgi:hypothetical protein